MRLAPFLSSALLALSVAGAAAAQTTAAPAPSTAEGGHGRRHHRFDPARMTARLDANGDGRLQIAELPERMAARLAGADANRDGVIAPEEIRAHMEAQRAARMAQIDADHDGTITPEEFRAHMQARQAERFARLDTNSDGAVTEAEVGAERWAHIGRADANSDGRVTADELAAARHGGRGAHRGHGGPQGGDHGAGPRGAIDPARMIRRFDRDGDGTLRVAELPPRMQTRLGAADTNRDGTLASSEITQAIQARRAARAARTGR
jgi:hypothetical protein